MNQPPRWGIYHGDRQAYRSNPPVDMMDKLLCALPTPSQAQQQRQEDLSKEILAV